MHIHLPKPLHGWREFLGEVGIIVIGVLIALGAEQIIEGFHWQHEVEAGRESINGELLRIVRQSTEREVYSRCLGQRLQDIAGILDQASTTGQLPPTGPIGAAVKRLWHLQSWDNLVAAETATHFPKQDMLALGNLDAYIHTVGALNDAELYEWSVLWTIVGPGRRLAVGEEAQLRAALARAGYDAKMMRISAHQLIGHIRDERLLSHQEIDGAIREELSDMKTFPQSGLCRPIGPAPAHYGGSPLKPDLMAPFPADK